MKPYRVLVTGSRYFTHEDLVRRVLGDLWARNKPIVVVHGACRTGADVFADEWVKDFDLFGAQVERHKADWKKHGKSAGPIRNQDMVDAGADICLAFFKGESRGTKDCAMRALEAGITVVPYHEDLLDRDRSMKV